MGVKWASPLISNVMAVPSKHPTLHFSTGTFLESEPERVSPHLNMGFVLQGVLRPGRLHSISCQSKSLVCASGPVGSPELFLRGRWCSAAAPLVSSGRRQAFRSRDAAGAPLRSHDQPPAAVRPRALDGGLWLSAKRSKGLVI